MEKHKHLTAEDRKFIEDSLNHKMSFVSIAKALGKDPTTISKEVRIHAIPWRKSVLKGKNYNNSEPLGFSDIWLAYPEHRRNRREEAAELVAKAMESGATVQAFIDALNVEKNSYSWSQNNGQYVPGIVKWLQRESWRNYVTPRTSLEDDEGKAALSVSLQMSKKHR